MSCSLRDAMSWNPQSENEDLQYSLVPESGTVSLLASESVVFGEDVQLVIGELQGSSSPIRLEWVITEMNEPIALGLWFSGDAVIGTAENFLYVSDGRIVVDGAVYGTAPTYGVGDTVVLNFDPLLGQGSFYLNGMLVA